MSTALKPRHALGLPAGSIRAILAFGVLGYLWVLALSPGKEGKSLLEMQKQATSAFIYLQMLMVLILAHFFTAHGKSIGGAVSAKSPLGMPRGSVRFLLLGGYLGLAFFMFQRHRDFQLESSGPVLLDLAVLVTAFLLGHFITGIVRTIAGDLPAWFQDIQAWFAIVSLVVLGVVVIIRLVINTSLPYETQIDPEIVEMILASVVGFYFGARS